MVVRPIVNDSGSKAHLVVNQIFFCSEHGAMAMEYTYSLPKENYRESVKEWKKHIVAITKETGNPMTMTVGDLVETHGMLPKEMVAGLNRRIRKAPFNKVYRGAVGQ